MNAGTSEHSQAFIAKHADLAFTSFWDKEDLEGARTRLAAIRQRAADRGRVVQIWAHGYVVSKDTDAEAQDFLEWYRDDCGDYDALERMVEIGAVDRSVFAGPEGKILMERMRAGTAGVEFLGSPDSVVEQMKFIADAGCDGVLLSWPDWTGGVPYFAREILPRMEQAGLREPFRPHAAPSGR